MLGPHRTARFYYDLVYVLFFPVWDSLKIYEKQIQPKSGGSLKFDGEKTQNTSHTSVLKQEQCDKAPWLMSATPSVESKRLQQPWKWIKWIKWISQLLNCRYGQPRIWYQPSKMGIGNWKPPYIPIWCLHHHPVQARPPYLISPYLSQNLAPQPSVIPTVLLDTPCWDSQKFEQDHWISVISVIPAITINALLTPLSKINQNLLLLNASRK